MIPVTPLLFYAFEDWSWEIPKILLSKGADIDRQSWKRAKGSLVDLEKMIQGLANEQKLKMQIDLFEGRQLTVRKWEAEISAPPSPHVPFRVITDFEKLMLNNQFNEIYKINSNNQDTYKKRSSDIPAFSKVAFLLNRPSENPVVNYQIDYSQWIRGLTAFNVLNRDGRSKVCELIISTCANGFPIIANQEERTRSRMMLLYIVSKISENPSSLKTEVRESCVLRLADAFTACQIIQTQVVNAIYNDLCHCNTLDSRLNREWQNYKNMVFESWIADRHPETKLVNMPSNQQFPHIKSAYLDLLGADLGYIFTG